MFICKRFLYAFTLYLTMNNVILSIINLSVAIYALHFAAFVSVMAGLVLSGFVLGIVVVMLAFQMLATRVAGSDQGPPSVPPMARTRTQYCWPDSRPVMVNLLSVTALSPMSWVRAPSVNHSI